MKSFKNVCYFDLYVLGIQIEALFEVHNHSYRLRKTDEMIFNLPAGR